MTTDNAKQLCNGIELADIAYWEAKPLSLIIYSPGSRAQPIWLAVSALATLAPHGHYLFFPLLCGCRIVCVRMKLERHDRDH